MVDLAQSDLRTYSVGRAEEPFPSIHVSFARAEEEGNESRLDAITVLALLIVNSGLIMAVMSSGAARFEAYPGAEAVLAALWSLQAVITLLFFVVVARWLKR